MMQDEERSTSSWRTDETVEIYVKIDRMMQSIGTFIVDKIPIESVQWGRRTGLIGKQLERTSEEMKKSTKAVNLPIQRNKLLSIL